jgi:hypothetical protein
MMDEFGRGKQMEAIFAAFNEELERENEKRQQINEACRKISTVTRKMVALVQMIHSHLEKGS